MVVYHIELKLKNLCHGLKYTLFLRTEVTEAQFVNIKMSALQCD